jgi:hypothetical protein
MLKALFWVYVVSLFLLAILGFSLFTYTEGLSIEGLAVFIFHIASLIFLLAVYKGKLELGNYTFLYCGLYLFVMFWGSWNILEANLIIFSIMLLVYMPLPILAIYFSRLSRGSV